MKHIHTSYIDIQGNISSLYNHVDIRNVRSLSVLNHFGILDVYTHVICIHINRIKYISCLKCGSHTYICIYLNLFSASLLMYKLIVVISVHHLRLFTRGLAEFLATMKVITDDLSKSILEEHTNDRRFTSSPPARNIDGVSNWQNVWLVASTNMNLNSPSGARTAHPYFVSSNSSACLCCGKPRACCGLKIQGQRLFHLLMELCTSLQ